MMDYTFDDLTQMIGTRAESIISSDLGLESIGRSMYACFLTQHDKGQKNAPTQFFPDSFKFKCHDCGLLYDIKDHAKAKFSDGKEQYKYLEGLAGVTEVKREYKPMKKEKATKYNARFSGLQQMQIRGTWDNPKMLEYLESRSISQNIAKMFHISGDDEAVYLNYWASNGKTLELARIKGRKIGDIPNGQDKYLKISGGESILFGSHLYNGQRVLIVLEGEFDALAMTEGIYHINAQSHCMAVSVPSGASSVKWIESCKDFLKQFDTIVVCPDIDKTGIKMRENCFDALKDYDVRWIDLSVFLKADKYNDVNSLLITQGKKVVADLLKHIEKPYHSCGMLANKIQREAKRELFFTGFYGLDRACKFKFGELAVLAGESNDGKTTITRQMLITAIKNGQKVGAVFGEETPEKFMDLTIRQAYHGGDNFESQMDYFGDSQFQPKFEVEDQWRKEYGKNVNLFQLDRVRDTEKIGEKILDWVSHCADIEGHKVFFIDNLMKVTADEDSDEYVAQAKFIEKLYRLAQKKGVFIMMIVHTKKITGLINQNSIHGTKKIYNTPDYVLFFQRMDRFSATDKMNPQQANDFIRYKAGVNKEQEFTSFIWAHKIRDRNSSYSQDMHVLEYDFKTTCSSELLSAKYTSKVHENGWSKIIGEYSKQDSNF